MMDLFNLHWDTHPDKKCEACGKQLWGDNNTCYHDHLLTRQKHPEHAFNIDCLALVCFECHTGRHRGILAKKYLSLIEEAKELILKNESSNNQSGKR